MELIFDGLLALSLLFGLAWGLSVRRSLTLDRAKAEEDARQVQREAEEARRQAEREARLNRPGEPLRCLGCENTFAGPLGPDGCPHCRLASLVVPESECSEKGH